MVQTDMPSSSSIGLMWMVSICGAYAIKAAALSNFCDSADDENATMIGEIASCGYAVALLLAYDHFSRMRARGGPRHQCSKSLPLMPLPLTTM